MKRSESLSRSGSNAAPFQAFTLPALRRCSPIYLLIAAGSFGLAGCAQQPSTMMHGKEYFPSSVYGAASPRVVADGEAIPHGGGVYKTGHVYTVDGHTYYPMQGKHYSGVGMASWYGDAFHGRRTANGEIYDRNSITAAHPTMPLPSYARVTNLRNHYSIIVRVNDRGPFAPGRIMDVSRRVAELLDFRRTGTTKVRVDYVGQASLAGSDDQKLMATLRQDGQLAQLDMRHPPTYDPVQTASAEPDDTVPPATASAASTATDVADNSPPPDVVFKGKIPSPPSRPFDLGTIPGADAQISASR
jgi:rare lipoprotein A